MKGAKLVTRPNRAPMLEVTVLLSPSLAKRLERTCASLACSDDAADLVQAAVIAGVVERERMMEPPTTPDVEASRAVQVRCPVCKAEPSEGCRATVGDGELWPHYHVARVERFDGTYEGKPGAWKERT